METPSETNLLISLENVMVEQKKQTILQNVNWTVQKGEFIYLLGKTGSGKSTLLRALYADLPISEGRAVVNGYDLKQIKRGEIPFLRRKMGIIFQDFKLMTDRSVEQNLDFVLTATGWKKKKERKKRIEEVLALVDLKTKGFKMPFELSGGEQQRLSIARALLNYPTIILADEPTGNLDPDTSENIIRLLLELADNQGVAVIVATHDYLMLERFPNRVVQCQNGRLIENSPNH